MGGQSNPWTWRNHEFQLVPHYLGHSFIALHFFPQSLPPLAVCGIPPWGFIKLFQKLKNKQTNKTFSFLSKNKLLKVGTCTLLWRVLTLFTLLLLSLQWAPDGRSVGGRRRHMWQNCVCSQCCALKVTNAIWNQVTDVTILPPATMKWLIIYKQEARQVPDYSLKSKNLFNT